MKGVTLPLTMHIPVLLHEAINVLTIQPGDTIVDGTYGGGGHTKQILAQYGENVQLICVDLDEGAKARFQEEQFPSTVQFVQANFKDVPEILTSTQKNQVQKVLLDLGTSTFQLLSDDRGFSFRTDMPLSMTFSHQGSHTGATAYDVVNEWSEETLVTIFKGFGEEPRAYKIAKAIVAAREQEPIQTSAALASVIEKAIGKQGRAHPATKVFQAIRIAVNDELTVLEQAIEKWWQVLAPGGRLAIITFHSLEDRIVKRAFASYNHQNVGRVITKKPITPSREEIINNPRSRSAKLRSIEKK